MKIRIASIIMLLLLISCVSVKKTIKNVDDNAPIPRLSTQNSFIVTEYATDKRYGYDPEYPINCFYRNTKDDVINQQRFINALTGPNGEKLFFKKVESCCPFPSKRTEMGAGFLDVYEITWVGLSRPIKLYFNIYDKGHLMVPVGFEAKKDLQPK